MKYVVIFLCLSGLSYHVLGISFARRLFFGRDTSNDEEPKIFNYNQYLRSPYSARVDSKTKVETLGTVLKSKQTRFKVLDCLVYPLLDSNWI